IVKSDQTKHRQEDSQSQSCRAFYVERIIFIKGVKSISTVQKSEYINRGTGIQRKWIPQLHGKFVVDTGSSGADRREVLNLISPHVDLLLAGDLKLIG